MKLHWVQKGPAGSRGVEEKVVVLSRGNCRMSDVSFYVRLYEIYETLSQVVLDWLSYKAVADSLLSFERLNF